MTKERNQVAVKLLEAFRQFHRVSWNRSPIIGIKPSEIMVLFCISKKAVIDSPGIKVSEISSLLKVAPPTVTQLINGLEDSGFIERAMDQEDRRAVRVKLTEKGQEVIGKASDAFFDTFNGLVEHLGEEKSKELTELLSEVFVYFNEKNR